MKATTFKLFRKKNKHEIEILNNCTNLDTLLKLILEKISHNQLLKVGIKKAIALAKKMKVKPNLKDQLNELSLGSDKMHVKNKEDTEESHDVTKDDIDKILDNFTNKSEDFFKDSFNFATLAGENDLRQTLSIVRELEFDIFELEERTNGNELFVLIMHLMMKDNYLNDFNITQKRLKNFAYTVQSSYNDIPYHNKTHAADV